MTPYYSFASYLRSTFYEALVLPVRMMLRSLQRCNRGSDMYNDLKFTLEVVDELGRLKLADALAKAADIHTQAPGCGRRSGGRRGGGQAGPGRATEPEPIYEEGDESGAENHGFRVIGYSLTMASGHPTLPVMLLLHPILCPVVLARSMRPLDSPPICRPQCSVDQPMMVDAYLSPHQACPPHL